MCATVLALAVPGAASGQNLADFDYEDLAFRGLGVWGSAIWPSRVESTGVVGLRADLGYAGPGLRVVPSVGYWSSNMDRSDVAELSRRVADLVDEQAPPGTPPAEVDLGEIDWSDLLIGVDAHFVWAVPFDLLTYVGLGFSAHITDGSGEAIDDTFVEDLIDSFAAGINAHTGVEYLLSDRFRIFGEARFEVQSDLHYPELRGGVTIHFGDPAPGEERGR